MQYGILFFSKTTNKFNIYIIIQKDNCFLINVLDNETATIKQSKQIQWNGYILIIQVLVFSMMKNASIKIQCVYNSVICKRRYLNSIWSLDKASIKIQWNNIDLIIEQWNSLHQSNDYILIIEQSKYISS